MTQQAKHQITLVRDAILSGPEELGSGDQRTWGPRTQGPELNNTVLQFSKLLQLPVTTASTL